MTSGERISQLHDVARPGELRKGLRLVAGIPQIKPTFLDIAPSGIPSNIIPHSKGIKCGLIRSNSPFSYSNHRPAKPKIPKPLVYAQVSPWEPLLRPRNRNQSPMLLRWTSQEPAEAGQFVPVSHIAFPGSLAPQQAETPAFWHGAPTVLRS